MIQYRYRYIDAYETVEGVVDATDIAGAAIVVLRECGSEPKRPRWKRYDIPEDKIDRVPKDAEFVVFEGFETGSYALEIIKVGSRKRKPLRFYA